MNDIQKRLYNNHMRGFREAVAGRPSPDPELKCAYNDGYRFGLRAMREEFTSAELYARNNYEECINEQSQE